MILGYLRCRHLEASSGFKCKCAATFKAQSKYLWISSVAYFSCTYNYSPEATLGHLIVLVHVRYFTLQLDYAKLVSFLLQNTEVYNEAREGRWIHVPYNTVASFPSLSLSFRSLFLSVSLWQPHYIRWFNEKQAKLFMSYLSYFWSHHTKTFQKFNQFNQQYDSNTS